MRTSLSSSFSLFTVLVVASGLSAGDASVTGKLMLDDPTLYCLGVRWLIGGDANHNASVNVAYRNTGAKGWNQAMPLFRVESAALEMPGEERPPDGMTMFAGSLFYLTPGTSYELRLSLKDSDGGSTEKVVTMQTWKEPVAPRASRTFHVVPGKEGGSGSADDPFRGLAAAIGVARPGDLFLLHKGVYEGVAPLSKNGTEDAPIVWRAAGDGEAVIEGEGPYRGAAISLSMARHVFIEGLSIRNARWGIVLNGGRFITIRRCHFYNISSGITGSSHGQRRVFIADNVFEGTRSWPPKKSHRRIEDRGVELAGTGHVVMHNRFRFMRDGVDTRTPFPIRAIDICYNDISGMQDDAIELDFSEQNCRAYNNLCSNCGMGISFQPIHGGPAYAVRNVLYNIKHETFKLHLTPTGNGHRTSGGVLLHNTVVKTKPPVRVWSDEGPAHYFYLRNNLLVGVATSAIDISCPMRFMNFDHDLYVGPFKLFAYWNQTKYPSIADFRRATGLEKHGFVLPSPKTIFASIQPPSDWKNFYPPEKVNPRLAPGSPALDRGAPLPNINDDFTGRAPDIGAVEFGDKAPVYGPRL